MTVTRRKRTTLKQVAQQAGVSPTTVSFVLNKTPGTTISPATQTRVIDAARALDYLPSAAARSLVTGRTNTIGLVIHEADLLLVDAFVPQLLYGLNQVAQSGGYTVQVEGIDTVVGDDQNSEGSEDDPYLRMIQARGLDGLIVLDPRDGDTNLVRRIKSGTPIVTLGAVVGAEPYRVVSDNAEGMRCATEHLLALGRTRIAHLTFSPRGRSGTDGRLTGYREAIENAGMNYNEVLVEETGYSAASGADAMARLLSREPKLDAVTCGNDTVALGAIAALKDAGRQIPDDVAVVGFDDLPLAAQLRPALTTVRTDPVATGERAMEMLLQLIGGQAPAQREAHMPTELVVRHSCGARSD